MENLTEVETPRFAEETNLLEVEDTTEFNKLPNCNNMSIENKQICENYRELIKREPYQLENTEVFNVINKIALDYLQEWETNNYTEDKIYELKNENKNKLIREFFRVPDEQKKSYEKTFNKISQLTNMKKQGKNPKYEKISFQTKLVGTKDIYEFLFNAIYYIKSSLLDFKTTDRNKILNIELLKKQVGIDIKRFPPEMPIIINGIAIPVEDFENFKSNNRPTDYLNIKLMQFMNEQQLVIDMNIINIIDIVVIQHILGFIINLLFDNIILISGLPFTSGRIQSYIIDLTKDKKNIEITSKQNLINIDDGIISGSINLKFKINLSDITDYSVDYGFEINENDGTDIDVEPTMTNIGTNAVNYVKENPGSVAAATGISSVLAAGVGTLFAVGILGGKTKKRLHNRKYKSKKSKKFKKQSVHKKTKKHKRHYHKTITRSNKI